MKTPGNPWRFRPAIPFLCVVRIQDEHWQSLMRSLGPEGFEDAAMELFRWQSRANPIYARFCELLHRGADRVSIMEDIPFLPVSFFKTHTLLSGEWESERVFTSSATTGVVPSRHEVQSFAWYLETAESCFAAQYGSPGEWAWLALLPGYLEREGSSLVAMADHFIHLSKYPESGFYLDDLEGLKRQADLLISKRVPVIVLGVTHALLQFADRFPSDWGDRVMVMETGGMKGHGPERVRGEVHRLLREKLGLPVIHSEYGMTELFSQAYSTVEGRFMAGPFMRVTVRDINDPFSFPGFGRSGALCIIDLANYATQAFLATQDVGRVYPDGSFEVLGRLDGSDIRGCNLMVGDLD